MKSLKKTCCYFIIFLNLLISNSIQAQTIEDKIAAITTNYFELERESFHLQCNKNTYLTDESIWFKGFVFDKKNNLPNSETTNVYVNLFSPSGQKLDSKLCYGRNGTFQGNFKLKTAYLEGTYYIQVSTNWCNNFVENESGIFNIAIINTDSDLASKTLLPTINFHPEGGVFLSGITNSMGISILDCNNNAIEITDGIVWNSKGEEIAGFQTNSFGFGKFDIIQTNREIYKISFNYKNQKIEKELPLPVESGTVLSVNNYSNDTKTFVTIKTNDVARKTFEGKKLFLTVNQNEKIVIAGFQFKDNTNTIVLANSDLFEGINTFRIIDENLNKLNERIVYKTFVNTFDIKLEVSKKTIDSIEIKGISNITNFKIGVSVLPENSLSINKDQTIFSSLNINSYLKKPLKNGSSFFENPTKKKYYDLDVILLNQNESKYDWETMKNPPVAKYKFNKGITLKGVINEEVDNKKNYKIQVFSLLADLNEFSNIDEKNEFYFRNFIAMDSTKINFTLVKNGEKYKELNFLPKVINEDIPFLKKLELKNNTCEWIQKPKINNIPKIEMPIIKEAIQLKDIQIINEPKKPILANQNKYGNRMMKGFKITNDEYNMYNNVISFIAGHGFDAGSKTGSVYIKGRTRINITRPNIPTVFLDDIEVTDFNILDNMSLKLVSEIYINKNGTTIQSTGTGVIKIYTNKEYRSAPRKSLAKSFIISNAFAIELNYKNPTYASYSDEGFSNYGTIFWEPNLETEGNLIQFSIPNLNQKRITVQIEGISTEGKLISTIKTINLD